MTLIEFEVGRSVNRFFDYIFRSIPDMQNDVELHVMNRGLLSDEFIGYVPVPLNQFGVYERPESRYDIPQPGWYI